MMQKNIILYDQGQTLEKLDCPIYATLFEKLQEIKDFLEANKI